MQPPLTRLSFHRIDAAGEQGLSYLVVQKCQIRLEVARDDFYHLGSGLVDVSS
jgi:hypothetical protein